MVTNQIDIKLTVDNDIRQLALRKKRLAVLNKVIQQSEFTAKKIRFKVL